jgi:integrase
MGEFPIISERRLKQAGLPDHYSPHSFRSTGITNFLENDGTLEAAQRIAGHADSRTTKLYDRRGQKILLEDIERIRYKKMPDSQEELLESAIQSIKVRIV